MNQERPIERFCVCCRAPVANWVAWTGPVSPFLDKLAAVGSTVVRFGCPNCGCSDRDRHLRLFLNRMGVLANLPGAAVLHMAPEAGLVSLITTVEPARYVCGDLYPSRDEIERIDLQHIPYDDTSFDLVIANHVLEHVNDPDLALNEVLRVLKPGGRFICQTPYASRLTYTLEDPILQTPEDREYFYGQDDHLRLFGLDLPARITSIGFEGRLVAHSEVLADVDPEAWGINEREPFFDFVKP